MRTGLLLKPRKLIPNLAQIIRRKLQQPQIWTILVGILLALIIFISIFLVYQAFGLSKTVIIALFIIFVIFNRVTSDALSDRQVHIRQVSIYCAISLFLSTMSVGLIFGFTQIQSALNLA